MRLSVLASGEVAVVIPRFASESVARSFVLQKYEWIIKRLLEIKERSKLDLPLVVNARDYARCKLQALTLVEGKIAKFQKIYSFEYNKIFIKNQKTVWGSCSSQKNLNFSYKILGLEDDLVEYIVAHELCHLVEMNHSRNFWSLVENLLPDYKEKRKKLKNIKVE